jgi:hypothetical protein
MRPWLGAAVGIVGVALAAFMFIQSCKKAEPTAAQPEAAQPTGRHRSPFGERTAAHSVCGAAGLLARHGLLMRTSAPLVPGRTRSSAATACRQNLAGSIVASIQRQPGHWMSAAPDALGQQGSHAVPGRRSGSASPRIRSSSSRCASRGRASVWQQSRHVQRGGQQDIALRRCRLGGRLTHRELHDWRLQRSRAAARTHPGCALPP